MRKPLIIHPFLFALFPVIFLYAHNADQTMPVMVLRPLVAVLAGTVILWGILNLIVRNRVKSGLIISLWLLLFFSYGHFFGAIENVRLTLAGINLGPNKILMALWVVIAVLGAFFLLRLRKDPTGLTKIANFIGFILILISLINLGMYFVSAGRVVRGGETKEGVADTGKGTLSGDYPDIYYIILDAYANARALKEVFNYDNREFIEYLTDKGFYVVPEGHSNYCNTTFSLGSSLNMEYLNYLSKNMGEDSVHVRYIHEELLQKNEVMKFLKSKGYRIVNIGSGWSPADHSRNADLNLQCTKIDEFSMLLLQSTILRPLADRFIETDIRNRILYAFKQIPRVSRKKGPNFIFSHIMLPHPPFVFGRNGEPIPKTKLELTGEIWSEGSRYVDQLIYTNKLVRKLIEKIINSEPPPIIILQADHGPYFTGRPPVPTERVLSERLSILNAYHLPPEVRRHLYETITPVNSFRLLFKHYFGEDMELLKDVSYYSTYEKPYKFFDVTEKLK